MSWSQSAAKGISMDAAAAELGGILTLKEAGGKEPKAFLWAKKKIKSRFHLTPDGFRREINTPCGNTTEHQAATHVSVALRDSENLRLLLPGLGGKFEWTVPF